MKEQNYRLSICLGLLCLVLNHTLLRAESRPNILFIMSDDHANKAISAYDDSLVNTPNIDRLANEGALFENAFVTNAICGPSRAVILTGKHSHLNGMKTNRDEFDGSQVTFPKLLRHNNYQTAVIGKWHLKTNPTGFDYWKILPGQGHYYNPDMKDEKGTATHPGYVTDVITDESISWLKQRDSEKPFFLMVHHKAPHRNWMPNLKYLNRFEGHEFQVPENFHDAYTGRKSLGKQQLTISKHMDIQYDLKVPCETCVPAEVNRRAEGAMRKALDRMTSEQLEQWEEGYRSEYQSFETLEKSDRAFDEWKLQRYLEDYLRCIISVDESVGALLQFLDEEGLSENTLVIYTSDQGFFLGEHGIFDKRYMYEESLRTPLLMRLPGKIDSETIVSELVQNLDFASTFLDFSGVAIPDDFQGKSLKPLIEGDTSEKWRESIYYHFSEEGWGVDSHFGVRTSDFKLIHFYSDTFQWELYDLRNDPQEMHNLITDPNYADVLADLKRQLIELQTQYQDSVVLHE